MEAQDSLCAVIEAIIAVKENFKADYIIDILLGKETSEVLAHKHEELEVFGSGMGEEEKMWNAVIRQALIAGYLSKDVENYGLLKVTPEGHKFLKKPKSFKIVEDNDFEEEEEETPVRGGASCAVDPVLYSMLKDLRKKLSKKLDVPPLCYFPGSFFGGDGYHLSGDFGRIAEYSGRRCRKGKTLWPGVLCIDKEAL